MSRVFSRLLRSNTTLPLLLEMGLATISWGETSLEKPSWQTSNSRAWSHGRTTLVGTQRKGRKSKNLRNILVKALTSLGYNTEGKHQRQVRLCVRDWGRRDQRSNLKCDIDQYPQLLWKVLQKQWENHWSVRTGWVWGVCAYVQNAFRNSDILIGRNQDIGVLWEIPSIEVWNYHSIDFPRTFTP